MSDKKTILLLDDEPDLVELMQYELEAQGYDVVTAQNGVEGLQVLRTVSPDLIILDMNMPQMGGVEFYKNICDDKGQPKYPILVLTARANMEKLFKQFNIDGFMSKPFDVDVLVNEIAIIVKKKAHQPVRSLAKCQNKSVCIVENDRDVFNHLGSAFLNAGYIVHPAHTGIAAMESICNNVPDVVLMKLDLGDIQGDVAILKLKRMAKTQDVKFILYRGQTADNMDITTRLLEKEDVGIFVESNRASDLLEAVEQLGLTVEF